MSVDFFDTRYQERPRRDKSFGICDDENNTPAYTDGTDNAHWIAHVINNDSLSTVFTPIDNNIIVHKPGTSHKESTCDGMLTFTNSLYLVELKNRGTGTWVAEAKGQLINTIKLLHRYNDLSPFGVKKACICNKKHPYFRTVDNAVQKDFFHKTAGFRLDIQTELKIK
jgi:hypothetical protein